MGIKVLGDLRDDPIFQEVELPEGWEIKPAEGMNSAKLLDQRGYTRAFIFYDPSLVSREAYITICERFVLRENRFNISNGNVVTCDIVDVATGEIIDTYEDPSGNWDNVIYTALECLGYKYPELSIPGAYWEN